MRWGRTPGSRNLGPSKDRLRAEISDLRLEIESLKEERARLYTLICEIIEAVEHTRAGRAQLQREGTRGLNKFKAELSKLYQGEETR